LPRSSAGRQREPAWSSCGGDSRKMWAETGSNYRPRSQSSRKGCMSGFWQLAREKSLVPGCSEIRGNSFDISKGIFQNDICRFESYMPSQPVRSLCPMSRSSKYVRHSRRLATRGAVSEAQSSGFLSLTKRISGGSRQIAISVLCCKRLGLVALRPVRYRRGGWREPHVAHDRANSRSGRGLHHRQEGAEVVRPVTKEAPG
jgi:hypothetical protein